jgi:nucleotide-binding universal stress UspA family protein
MSPTVITPARIAIQNILVATDFSRLSDRAIDYALSFARRYESTVIATHVICRDLYVSPLLEQAYGEIDPLPCLDGVRREAKHRIEEIASSAADSGVKCIPKLLEGGISEQLSCVAEQVKADLMVIGTHGEERWNQLVMGSVAESIIHNARVPVITVGPRVFRRPMFEASFRHIVYATDFSSDSASAAPFAVSLAEEYNAKLSLLHVVPPELRSRSDQRELMAHFYQRLRRLVPEEARLWCEPEFIVEYGDASEAIIEFAEEHAADLLVLGTRKSNAHVLTYFKSGVAYHVMSRAECPVLTVTGEKEFRG